MNTDKKNIKSKSIRKSVEICANQCPINKIESILLFRVFVMKV